MFNLYTYLSFIQIRFQPSYSFNFLPSDAKQSKKIQLQTPKQFMAKIAICYGTIVEAKSAFHHGPLVLCVCNRKQHTDCIKQLNKKSEKWSFSLKALHRNTIGHIFSRWKKSIFHMWMRTWIFRHCTLHKNVTVRQMNKCEKDLGAFTLSDYWHHVTTIVSHCTFCAIMFEPDS